MTDSPAKKSDLGVRTLSAIVMLAVAGGALWLGGWWWTGFVGLLAMGVLWEWRGLVRGFTATPAAGLLWNFAGFVYIGLASFVLIFLRSDFSGLDTLLMLVGAVIATDVGAYFAGRTIGGPKIAPRISPSKTWAGLGGGIVGASLIVFLSTASSYCLDGSTSFVESRMSCLTSSFRSFALSDALAIPLLLPLGAAIAILAQSGDFLESWMKRRAGVKDSGNLIPGHGGLFDRADGLIAVLFVTGLFGLAVGGFQ
jgi:phosphatidate cytidylyltransferase